MNNFYSLKSFSKESARKCKHKDIRNKRKRKFPRLGSNTAENSAYSAQCRLYPHFCRVTYAPRQPHTPFGPGSLDLSCSYRTSGWPHVDTCSAGAMTCASSVDPRWHTCASAGPSRWYATPWPPATRLACLYTAPSLRYRSSGGWAWCGLVTDRSSLFQVLNLNLKKEILINLNK